MGSDEYSNPMRHVRAGSSYRAVDGDHRVLYVLGCLMQPFRTNTALSKVGLAYRGDVSF